MTGTDELLTAVPTADAPEIIDDLDDVEGHGLKEVVVGLSAAAVLGGGVASAAIPPIGDDLKTPGAAAAVVQGAQSDVASVTDPTTKMAASKANQTTGSATSLATTTAKTGVDTAVDTVRYADSLAADAISGAADTLRPVAEDPAGFVGQQTRPAVKSATSEVNSTTGRAVTLTQQVATDTTTLAKAAIKVVDTTVADGLDTASEIVVGLESTDLDLDLGVQQREMVMKLTAGGEAVAQAQWEDGQWRFTVESRHLDSPMTISVVDGKGIAPLTVHFQR